MNGIGQRLIFRAQPEVEKFNLELNKKKAASFKLQAWQWLKDTIGLIRKKKYMNEGMENLKQIEELEDRTINPLIRIADAIEEILRLVKKDMEPRDKNKK